MTCWSICDTLQHNSLGRYVAYTEMQQGRCKVYFTEEGQLGYNLGGLTERPLFTLFFFDSTVIMIQNWL